MKPDLVIITSEDEVREGNVFRFNPTIELRAYWRRDAIRQKAGCLSQTRMRALIKIHQHTEDDDERARVWEILVADSQRLRDYYAD